MNSSPDVHPPPLQPVELELEQQDNPEEEENWYSRLVNQVFKEDLLREMILDYVIHDNGKRLSSPDIKTCRFVQKSWLHTVSKLLRKQRSPLFILHLDKDNSLQESDIVQQNGKLLEQFLTNAFTSPSFEDDHNPPFSLEATHDFFEKENYNNFRDVLLKCGRGLINMNLEIPKNGGSMIFILPFSPQLSLPILTDVTIRFAAPTNNGDTDGFNGSAIHLIQSILNASHHSLKHFQLPFTQDTLPAGLEYLTLPVAMSTLDLSCQMNSKDLKILLNNSSLPNLTKLKLRIVQTRFDNGVISEILENYSKTLEDVYFQGVTHDGVSRIPTYFKIPVAMKKLTAFWITSSHLELENGLASLETCLPELNNLVLQLQTVPMFRKWTDSSKFENVLLLYMSLVNTDFPFDHENYYLNVEVEVMQSMHLAFPNLKTLQITVCGAEMSGLKYLLLEMKQLENLDICVRKTESMVNTDFWDSLLIGVGVEIAAFMRTTPEFSKTFKICRKGLSTPSIRNLSNLQELKIRTHGSPPALAKVPLISNSVFHFGFFKLRNLKNLVLGGRFKASKEMKKKWTTKTGQKIVYVAE